MLLIVGLGNPGRRYENHRHNVGFLAADEIHRRYRFGAWRARFEGEIAEGEIDGEKALVLKPMTFMNESGRSVGGAARFYKLKPADIVVIHDELDLPPGKLRMKTGGGNGGHKGLKSIDAHFGKDYRRIRIGIGHPGAKELVNGHVLHDFAKDDRDWLDPLLGAIAANAPLLVGNEDVKFMNQVHLATGEEKPVKAAREARPESREKVAAGVPEKAHRGGVLADGLRKLFRRPE